MSETTCTCGRPTAGAVLCDDCIKTLAYAVANTGAYYDDLATVAGKQTRYGTQVATRTIGKAQPMPVDGRFTDVAGRDPVTGQTWGRGTQARYDAWATVVAWCRTVMEDQPELTGPACINCLHISCNAIRRRRWPRNTIRSMCNYLDRQLRWIVREQWAPVMLEEFLDVERRLSRLVDRPAERWYAGKCSATDDSGNTCTAEVYAGADKGAILCRACGARHDVASRRDFLLKEAREYSVTATEAASALLAWTDYDGSEVKLVDRIRKWRDRGKLNVQDVTSLQGKDRHLYRLGDIQALLIENAQHAQTRRMDRPA